MSAAVASVTMAAGFLLSPGISGAAPQAGPIFERAFKSYRSGLYRQALGELMQAEKSARGEEAAKIAYLKGSCYKNLQQYPEAANAFGKASRLGVKVPGVHFEQGQALYAARDLEHALSAFEASRAKGFKPATSTYYLGYIDQVLEKHDLALGRYREILEAKDDSESVKQPAAYQGAEIRLVKAEELTVLDRKKEVLLAEVLPSYERAVDLGSDSPIAEQSRARIGQIREKYFPVVAKAWNLNVGENVKYDTNVVTQADQAVIQLSNTGSLISNTTAGGSYDLPYRGWSFDPRASLSSILHSRRDVGKVFQNDSIDLSPGVSASTAHHLFKKDASFTADYTFDYYLRDYTQTHKYSFFQDSHAVSVSEQLSYFGFGPSSLKLSYKALKSEDADYSARTTSVALTQAVSLWKESSGSSSLSADFQKADNPANDLYTYRWSNSISVPNVRWGIGVSPSVGLASIDTRNQRATRGTELELDAGLGFSRQFNSGVSLALDYAFTRQNSKDKENYAYSKHTLGMGISYAL